MARTTLPPRIVATMVAVASLLGEPDRARPSPLGGFRVYLAEPYRESVLGILEGSARWLESEPCAALFAEFRDGSRRPLRDRLDAMGLTAPEYLRAVVFMDGGSHSRCRNTDALAVTTPGSRVVHVCTPQFSRRHRIDRVRVQAVMIHEALHTLGLGENPPTSAEITERVLARCGN